MNTTTIKGGDAGGGGGSGGSFGASGGHGGNGGNGIVVEGAASLTNTAAGVIRGGVGGSGGNASGAAGGIGGNGGMGGVGVVMQGAGSLANAGMINGGDGFYGGGASVNAGSGGNGGSGIQGNGNTVTNTGTISGGNGFQGGSGSDAGAGSGGNGGTAVVGSNLTVINSGTLTGGAGGDGGYGPSGQTGTFGAAGHAVQFTGGTNTLELRSGSNIIGKVIAFSGQDTLALGGSTSPTAAFNVADLGAANSTAQYQGFGKFAKIGTSTWALTGTTTAQTPWTIKAGTLNVSDDAALGASAGGLTIDGGTLQAGANLTLDRATTLGSGTGGGGTIDTNGHNVTMTQAIGGPGSLTVTNNGVSGGSTAALTLSAAGTYTGGTYLIAGASVVANANNALGSGTVQLMGTGDQLTFANGVSAGTLTIQNGVTAGDNNNTVSFQGSASAGTASITNGVDGAGVNRNVVEFAGTSSAGHATLTNNASGTLQLLDNASGGSAHVTNNNLGRIVMRDNADAGGMTVVNHSGAVVDVSANSLAANHVAIGSLSGGGNVYLGDRSLTLGGLNQNDTISGVIQDGGSPAISPLNTATGGQIVKTGTATLTLMGVNTYTGGTALKQGRIDLGNNNALGTGTLSMADGTALGFVADGLNVANNIALTGTADPVIETGSFTETLSGVISGPGQLSKNGSGTLIVTGANTYTGDATVAEGTLRAGAVNTFSAASAHTVAAGATMDLAGYPQTIAGLVNSGTVSLTGANPGTTLTVTGPYVGNGGVLKVGTRLGDGTSVSDRMVLAGASASASGHTTVQVTNMGGLGALTVGNGIEVIGAVEGATTTAQTTKDAFTLAGGHVDAGAYEYRLYAADAAGQGESWYLRSMDATPTAPAFARPTYRAEVPLYSALPAVVRQGDLSMLSTLHRRMGDEAVAIAGDGTTGSGSASTGQRAWARVLSGRTSVDQGGVTAPRSDTSSLGLQAGLDLYVSAHWAVGLYAGQLRSDSRVEGLYGLNFYSRAYAGGLRVDSTYLGGYATYANPRGQYADFVLQYGHHGVNATPLSGWTRDSGGGNSVTGSVEVGQRFAFGQAAGGTWGIEPQAQLIVNRQSLGDGAIDAATTVHQDSATAVIGRLGVRVTGDFATSAGRFQPYARLNLWHGFGGTDTTAFRTAVYGTSFANRVGYTSTEAALGFTLALTSATSLYGEVSKLYRTGSGGNSRVSSSAQGSLGLKVRF